VLSKTKLAYFLKNTGLTMEETPVRRDRSVQKLKIAEKRIVRAPCSFSAFTAVASGKYYVGTDAGKLLCYDIVQNTVCLSLLESVYHSNVVPVGI